MSSGAWMVTLMISVFFITFSLSAAAVFHLFSTKLIPPPVRRSVSKRLAAILLAVLLVLTPLAALAIYLVIKPGMPPKEAFEFADKAVLGMWFVWFIVFKPTVPSLIVAVISPDLQGFSSWRVALSAYAIHLIGTAAVIKTISWLVV